jgi:membrane protein implicated in regulation of membrane protease activity
MTRLTRYVLFQIPGWLFATLLLLGLYLWLGFPLWVAAILLFVWMGKDFLLYPFFRTVYDADVKTGAERLVGVRGEVRRQLAPQGYVRVHGELWRAETTEQHSPILPGNVVRITGARGLTLLVAPDEETARE